MVNGSIPKLLRQFILLSVTSLLVYMISYSDLAVELLYSRGIYQLTSITQRFLSSLLPFSTGDLLYTLVVIYLSSRLLSFCHQLKRKDTRKTALRAALPKTVNLLLGLYLAFKLLWGLNYARLPIAAQLGISNEKYSTAELVRLGSFFIKKVNHLQKVNMPGYKLRQLCETATAAYHRLQRKNAFFSYPAPSVKPVLFSWIVTKMGIEGYYNPLSGEANVNMRLPRTELPFVTCHEIAHQLGIGREDEANLIGYLTASSSNDPGFRYSAAYAVLKNILFEIRIKSPEDYEKLYTEINPRTIADFRADRDFWRRYNGQMSAYTGFAFDRFLKFNNQQKGTDSYQDIVLWLYNIHKKDL